MTPDDAITTLLILGVATIVCGLVAMAYTEPLCCWWERRRVRGRNRRAVRMLDRWERDGDAREQRETLEMLRRERSEDFA